MKDHVFEEKRNIPVSGEADVVVVGAGIAGVAAALAAARNGAKTTLLEREYALGGMATLGLITIYLPLCDGMGNQVIFGIGEELLKLSISLGAEAEYPSAWLDGDDKAARAVQRYKVRYNPHIFALLAEKLLTEAGVKILYGTLACGVEMDGRLIKSVIVENKSGRSAIKTRSVVDCSGDADICALSGAETAINPDGNGLADWYYYQSGGKVDLNMFGLADVIPQEDDPERKNIKTTSIGAMRFSGVDGAELSGAVIEAHRQMLANILEKREKSPDYVPVCMSSIPLVRMSRRLVGRTTMQKQDENTFAADSIGMTGDWTRRGPIYEIPFSSLVSDKVANLIAAGRIISTSREVWNVTRVIPPSAVTGQAAGTAAAMFGSFDDADIAALQERLAGQNVKLHIGEVR